MKRKTFLLAMLVGFVSTRLPEIEEEIEVNEFYPPNIGESFYVTEEQLADSVMVFDLEAAFYQGQPCMVFLGCEKPFVIHSQGFINHG